LQPIANFNRKLPGIVEFELVPAQAVCPEPIPLAQSTGLTAENFSRQGEEKMSADLLIFGKDA